MSPTNSDLTIKPADAPLSRERARTTRRHRRSTLFGRLATRVVLLIVAASLALIVFVYVSNRIDPVELAAPTPSHGATAGNRRTEADAAPPIPPFKALQIEKARAAAKEELGRFVELELRLEQEMNSGAWATEELAAIKDRANRADQLFLADDFDAALTEYAAAVADFEALLERGAALVASNMEAGQRALEARDARAAAAAFERTLQVMPSHAPARLGLNRAERLPEVIELLREFDRAELREDHDAAADYLRRVRAVDSLTTGLAERFARVERALSERTYRENLSRGFAALEAGDFAGANAAFDAILVEDPGDAMALSGRQQTERARALARINQLREAALEHEHAEEWDEALAAYDEVLAIDSSIEFARDGKVRARRQSSLVQSIEQVLGDPASLSSDEQLAKGQKILRDAQAETDVGDAFGARRDRLQRLLAAYETPIPLVLLSDAETEVTIVRIGVLGAFERREVMLRPGRYIITGSRDGCRDVRKEIILGPETAPIEILCQERI